MLSFSSKRSSAVVAQILKHDIIIFQPHNLSFLILLHPHVGQGRPAPRRLLNLTLARGFARALAACDVTTYVCFGHNIAVVTLALSLKFSAH